MPEQTLRGEAIGSIVLDAPVLALHLMGVEECFVQASISYRRAV
jgi:NO-binding membrane sensor protein with MHYT domain